MDSSLPGSRRRLALQLGPDLLDEDADRDGLRQLKDGATLHGVAPEGLGLVGGHDEDRRLGRRRHDHVQHLQPPYPGHPNVQDHGVEGLRSHERESLLTAVGNGDASQGPERRGVHPRDRNVIIDHQDGLRHTASTNISGSVTKANWRDLPESFRRRDDRPAVVGHRGTRGVLPENTLEAIHHAHMQGADAIEIDVRTCKTGQVVVLHDPDLERLVHDPRRAADLDLHALRRLDLGGGARVPLLAEVLEETRTRGLGLNVEIKHDVPSPVETVRAVARELARSPHREVIVSSFDPRLLAAHKALCSAPLFHAQLVQRSTYHHVALLVARLGLFEGLHVEHVLAYPQRLSQFLARAPGYVAAWTVNDPFEARRLFTERVSALISDVPGEILAAFRPQRRVGGRPAVEPQRSDAAESPKE
jgi:glycerophosphoryl diester phosphodiesterase